MSDEALILDAVKHSEFQQAMRDTFGAYASSLAEDMVLAPLNSQTANQALADGTPPGVVWDAICTVNELGEDVRWRHRRANRAKQ